MKVATLEMVHEAKEAIVINDINSLNDDHERARRYLQTSRDIERALRREGMDGGSYLNTR